MAKEVEVHQYWIRNDKGQVWGPLSFASIELMVENQMVSGQIQASRDGLNFAFPGRFSDLRDAFPREMWGSTEPMPAQDPEQARAGPPVVGPPAAPASPTLDGMPASGSLAQHRPFKLYYLLAAQGATGKLAAQAGSSSLELLLRKGVPQQVRSSDPAESVLAFLRGRGLLSAESIAQAEEAAPRFGGDPISAAFALGLVDNPGEAVAAMTTHGQSLLRKLLLLGDGTFQYENGVEAPPTAMPLGQKWTLLAQAARALPAEEARRRLGEAMNLPVMKSGGRVALEELALNAQEARVAATFDGVGTPAQLAQSLGDADMVARVAYLLSEAELCSFAAVRQPAPPQPKPAKPASPPPPHPPKIAAPQAGPGARPVSSRPAPPPRPPPQLAGGARPAAAAPAAPAPVANDAKALEQLVERQKNQNHFEVLNLPEACTSAQVKATYLQMVKLYHPDTTPADAPPSVRAAKEKIFARVNEAQSVLSDDAARANYLEELATGGDEKVDMAAIFQAEEIFTKACIVVKARKYEDGVKMLEEAIELNAEEGEFYAWLGYARFMASKDRKAAFNAALNEALKALKMSPKCAPAAYLAGQMAKLMGDGPAALKWFKKTVEIDPKHIDALREIRLMGNK